MKTKLLCMVVTVLALTCTAKAQRVENESLGTLPLNSTITFSKNLLIPANTSKFVTPEGTDSNNTGCQLIFARTTNDRVLPAGSVATVSDVESNGDISFKLGTQTVEVDCYYQETMESFIKYLASLHATLAFPAPGTFQ